MLFASEGKVRPILVFAMAAVALVLSTAISVALGAPASRYLQHVPLKLIAGIRFVLIGTWTMRNTIAGHDYR